MLRAVCYEIAQISAITRIQLLFSNSVMNLRFQPIGWNHVMDLKHIFYLEIYNPKIWTKIVRKVSL